MKIRKLFLMLSLPLMLVGCSSGSIPKKGYQLYKEKISNYYKNLGGTGKEITYQSCYYVHITGDGNLPAEDLKNNVYYKINYTLTLGTSLSAVTYVYYDPDTNYVGEDSSYKKAYEYACDLVGDGALKGNFGSL